MKWQLVILIVLVLVAAISPAAAQAPSVCVVPGLYGDVTFYISGMGAGVDVLSYYSGGDDYAYTSDPNPIQYYATAAAGETVYAGYQDADGLHDYYFTNDGSWPECAAENPDQYGADGGWGQAQQPATGGTCFWQVQDAFGNWSDVASTEAETKDGTAVCTLVINHGGPEADRFRLNPDKQ